MIVVTGANGFIGRHVMATLRGAGARVVGVDFEGGHLDPLGFMDWLWSGIGGPGLRRSEIRAIVHLGAITDTTCQDAALLRDRNTRYSTRLWDWCAENGVRLVYASSAATYGRGEYGFSDSDHVTRLLRPLNPYGQSKHAMDLYALDRSFVLAPPSWAGLKFFNVYGPGEGRKGRMASMVHRGICQAREEGEIRLFRGDGGVADGGHSRDFVHVDDVVDVILFMLVSPGFRPGIFNVGTGEDRTFNDLALGVFAAMGREPVVRYVDMPEDLRRQYQDFTRADVDRLRSIGYGRRFTALEGGIKSTVEAV